VAVVLLLSLILLLGVGGLLATSELGRVRFWTWRLHSSDPEVARLARARLVAIGRPWIDDVLPELVVDELKYRFRKFEASSIGAFVGRPSGSTTFKDYVQRDYEILVPLNGVENTRFLCLWDDPDETWNGAFLRRQKPNQRTLVLLGRAGGYDEQHPLRVIEVPLNEESNDEARLTAVVKTTLDSWEKGRASR
jgi:hypothetical protein